jgi:hypothetical protein
LLPRLRQDVEFEAQRFHVVGAEGPHIVDGATGLHARKRMSRCWPASVYGIAADAGRSPVVIFPHADDHHGLARLRTIPYCCAMSGCQPGRGLGGVMNAVVPESG